MKYNTDKNKHILIPVETKNRLDEVIKEIIKERIKNCEMNLRVSYNDCIKYLLDK